MQTKYSVGTVLKQEKSRHSRHDNSRITPGNKTKAGKERTARQDLRRKQFINCTDTPACLPVGDL